MEPNIVQANSIQSRHLNGSQHEEGNPKYKENEKKPWHSCGPSLMTSILEKKLCIHYNRVQQSSSRKKNAIHFEHWFVMTIFRASKDRTIVSSEEVSQWYMHRWNSFNRLKSCLTTEFPAHSHETQQMT